MVRNKIIVSIIFLYAAELTAMAPVHEYRQAGEEEVSGLELIRSGKIMLVPQDTRLVMRDLAGEEIGAFVDDSFVDIVQRTRDERLIATAARTLKVWDVETQKAIYTLPNPAGVVSFSFDNAGNILAAYSYWDSGLAVYDLRAPSRQAKVNRARTMNSLVAAAVSADGENIFLGRMTPNEDDAMLQRAKPYSCGEVLDTYSIPCGDINYIAASGDGNNLAISDAGRKGWLVDARTGKAVWNFAQAEAETFEMLSYGHLAFDGDSNHLCAASNLNDAQILDVNSQQHVASLKNSAGIDRVVWNGNTISGLIMRASPTSDTIVRVWDISEVMQSRLVRLVAKCRELLPDCGCL
jgi:WD40 repeat protein